MEKNLWKFSVMSYMSTLYNKIILNVNVEYMLFTCKLLFISTYCCTFVGSNNFQVLMLYALLSKV